MCFVSIPDSAALYFWLFPSIADFSWFWLAMPALFVFIGMTGPFNMCFQALESPPKKAGMVFAINVAARSIIPAIQHVIVGALWNFGDDSHPWFFRWFGILNVMSGVVFLAYIAARYKADRRISSTHEYSTVS